MVNLAIIAKNNTMMKMKLQRKWALIQMILWF